MGESKIITLTENQKKAVMSKSKRIAVIAGPGSGKTCVLTERICHLVNDLGVKESEILALSYSTKAAKEVRKRLKDQLSDKYYKVSTKTFHSLGLQIIRENIDLLGYTSDFDILNSNVRNKIIRKVLQNNSVSEKDIKEYSQNISKIKNGAILNNPDIVRICNLYNRELKHANTIDFDDMIALPLELFKQHPHLADNYKKEYSHILIDEVQDLNEYQIQLVQMLLRDDTSMFVVGDDDQCIYEWRGAKPDYLKNLAADKEFEVIKLEDNFRSDSAIVNLSDSLINHNLLRIKKNTTAHKKRKTTYNVSINSTIAKRFNSSDEEARFIASEIFNFVESGMYGYNDFAILVRKAQQAGAIKMALERYKIPCYEQVSDSFDFDEIIQVLSTILKFDRKHGINRAINFPIMIMDNFLFTEIANKYQLNKDLSISEAFEILNKDFIQFEDSDIFKSRYRLLKEMSQNVNTLKVTEIIEKLQCLYASEPFAKSKKAKEKFEHLQNLLDVAKEFENTLADGNNSYLKDFLDYISLSSNEENAETDVGAAVNLMTCHKSKGLEFPIVFIPGVQVGVFPNEYFVKTKEDLEAERRLFYVSMTRAINKLYITCYADPFRGDGTIKKGFLGEIPGIKF
jgi:DNA helicase-2/ATP-dependent DNA helicase PcrA